MVAFYQLPKSPGNDQSRTYALGFQILPSDSMGFRDKEVSDSIGFCNKKVSDAKKVTNRIPLRFFWDSIGILKIQLTFWGF